MKSLTLFLLGALLVFCSCERKPIQATESQKHEVPKPLQNDNKEFSLISKRSSDENLVDAIYADLLKKNMDLKNLNDQIQHFNEGHADSLQEFNDYDEKSNNYYNSATETLNRITDTALKKRLRILLANSQKNYTERTAKFKSIIKQIDNDQLTKSDYYLTLKIAATMPVIQDYQQNNMPDRKRITAIANESDNIKSNTKKLAEKYQDKLIYK